VLFDKSNPRNAINRRISIIVMTKQAEEAALATDTAPQVQAADLPAVVSPAGASEPATGTAAPASAVAH